MLAERDRPANAAPIRPPPVKIMPAFLIPAVVSSPVSALGSSEGVGAGLGV